VEPNGTTPLQFSQFLLLITLFTYYYLYNYYLLSIQLLSIINLLLTTYYLLSILLPTYYHNTQITPCRNNFLLSLPISLNLFLSSASNPLNNQHPRAEEKETLFNTYLTTAPSTKPTTTPAATPIIT